MQKFIRNQFCNDTIHVNVRLNKEEYKALKEYMAVCAPKSYDGTDIFFPMGVRLVKQGYGWYKLIPPSEHKAVQKIEWTLKRPIAEFLAEQSFNRKLKLHQERMGMLDGLQLAAYSSAHDPDGELLYVGMKGKVCVTRIEPCRVILHGDLEALEQPRERKPVDKTKIAALAARFGHALN